MALGSASAVTASSNVTLCRRALAAALSLSHSKSPNTTVAIGWNRRGERRSRQGRLKFLTAASHRIRAPCFRRRDGR